MTELTKTESTFYFVEAECEDEQGRKVRRRLGVSADDQPQWTTYGSTAFKTYEEALEAAKYPRAYSVYDGRYTSGAVKIYKRSVETLVTATTSLVTTIIK
jgi:hypothetical protein